MHRCSVQKITDQELALTPMEIATCHDVDTLAFLFDDLKKYNAEYRPV